MDSIIARQKIGKRRPASEPRGRPTAERRPYPPLLGDRLVEAPLGATSTRPSRRGRSLPKLAFRAFSFGSPLGFLSRPLRSLRKKTSRLPKPRLALVSLALVLALLALVVGMAAVIRGPAFPLPRAELLPAADSDQDILLEYVSPELADGKADAGQDSPALPPAPVTLEMSSYTVRSGDSLATIAKRFGLNIDSIISANGITSSSSVRTGTQLRIPNIDGLVHKVRPGDNLATVAKRYKTDTTKIVDANDLGSSRIVVGQSLFIPGARLPKATIAQALGQRVAWPARGPLSSYFGYRPDPFTGVWRFHAGIDIVVNAGTQVRAAMAGRIADVGYNGNYGNYIIINHADGYQTLYGHLSSASAIVGASVDQGAVIGLSGNTGYSTGPHLHFGLFRRSLALNPLKFLK